MPDQKKPKPEQPEALEGLSGPAPVDAEGASPAQAPADPPAASPAATPDAGPPAPSPETQIAALEGQVAELNDKLLRALAEAENVRRRAERDREDAFKYAVANFARDVLGVADNLRRATESIDADVRKADPAVDKVMAGIELTEREMLATFERYGIKPVAALGEKFDHNRHEALFEVEDKARPAGTVVQVLETGYTLHDRLLRPAKVGLAKGGPKVESRTEAKPEAAEPGRKASPGAPGAYESKGSEPGGKLDEKL
ncbi:MAG: nucleotide exchange factor GrpE [Rhodospirillales bacterium]|nr:nucleotide exchange factor GrpE [Rhodospirillales bacterium]